MSETYRGSDRLLFGMCLGVITYWLFGGAMTAAVPTMTKDLRFWHGHHGRIGAVG